MVKNLHIVKNISGIKVFYFLLYLYYFLLSLLMVTPFYYVLNPISIFISLICILNYSLIYKIRSKFIYFYLIQFLILFLNLFFIEHQDTGFEGFISLSKNIFTALIPALFIYDINKLKNFLIAFITGGAVNTLINVINGLGSLSTGERHISTDILLSINSFAHAGIVYFVCTVLLYSMVVTNKTKLVLLLNMFLILLSSMITGSRQVFISIFVFIVIVQVYRLKANRFKGLFKFTLSITSFIFMIRLMFIYFPYSPIVRRFTEGENKGDESRLYFSEQVWSLFLKEPVIGYGVDTFRYFSDFYIYTHSTYLELLFTGGVFYILFYFIYYFLVFKNANYIIKRSYNKLNRKIYIIMVACIGALLVNGLFYLVHASRLALSLQFVLVSIIFNYKFNAYRKDV